MLLPVVGMPTLAADRFDDVHSHIHSQMVEQSVPSICVAVAKDGKILWEESCGWTDREKRIEATPHTSRWAAPA